MMMTFIQYTPASYGSGDSQIIFPPWVNLLGWLMAATPIVVVLAVGGYIFYKKVIQNGYVSTADGTVRCCDVCDVCDVCDAPCDDLFRCSQCFQSASSACLRPHQLTPRPLSPVPQHWTELLRPTPEWCPASERSRIQMPLEPVKERYTPHPGAENPSYVPEK